MSIVEEFTKVRDTALSALHGLLGSNRTHTVIGGDRPEAWEDAATVSIHRCRLYATGHELIPGSYEYVMVWDTLAAPEVTDLPPGEPTETYTGATPVDVRKKVDAFCDRTGAIPGTWSLRSSF